MALKIEQEVHMHANIKVYTKNEKAIHSRHMRGFPRICLVYIKFVAVK